MLIDGDTKPTVHPKIYEAVENDTENGEIEIVIEQIKDAVESSDIDTLDQVFFRCRWIRAVALNLYNSLYMYDLFYDVF